MNDQNLIWPIVISFVVSSVLTFSVLRLALNYHLALPLRSRDVHQKQIPRLGGLGIFSAFFLVTLLYQIIDSANFGGFGFPFAVLGVSIDKRLLAVLVGSVVLVGTMYFDDIKGLKAYQKLSIQILVALIIIAGGIGITYLNNPFGGPPFQLDGWQIPINLGGVTYHFVPLADSLAIMWLVFLMNVLNFVDGIDGLAGTIGAVALFVLMSLSLGVSQSSTALLAAIGFGAVLGFLVWNVPPAKIFMGDTGSMFLGFLIGVIGLIAGAKLATTTVVLAIPVLDAIIVVAGRLLKGQNPLTHPDQTHLHHRFLEAGFSVRQTLLALGGISIMFGFAALHNTGIGKVRWIFIACLITALFVIALSIMRRRKVANL